MVEEILKDEEFGRYEVKVAKTQPNFYYFILKLDNKEISRGSTFAADKQQLINRIKQIIKNKERSQEENKKFIIVFKNMNQKVLYDQELSGQISDGNWENATPEDHWKIMCDAEVEVNPQSAGLNFRPMRTYNFANKELYDVVKNRMLFHVKAYNVLSFSPDFDILNDDEINNLFKHYEKYKEEEEKSNAAPIKKGDNVKVNRNEYRIYKIEDNFAHGVLYSLYEKFGYNETKVPDIEGARIKIDKINTELKEKNYYFEEKLERIKYELQVNSNDEAVEKLKKILAYPYTETQLKTDLKEMSVLVNNAYSDGPQLK